MCTPNCPACSQKLHYVRRDENSMLNREQFNAVKAGDWYCETCTSDATRSGHLYWSNKELKRGGQDICAYHHDD